MKSVTIKYLLLLYTLTLHQVGSGQLITAPNETKNGIKQGLWNEQEFLDSMSIDGHATVLFGQHYSPLYAVSEGLYVDGERSGIWKYFWIKRYLDSSKLKYGKGELKDMIDFNGGYRDGLFMSYFKNGRIRLLGHYKKIKNCVIDTLRITNPDTGIESDTVINSNYSSVMIGNWYQFDSSGNLSKTIDYGQHVAWRKAADTTRQFIFAYLPPGTKPCSSAASNANGWLQLPRPGSYPHTSEW